ncbi:MAG: TPM domain-containing protein [Candidatus Micrarchaeia archaeon]|jgi:uncharacterized protein
MSRFAPLFLFLLLSLAVFAADFPAIKPGMNDLSGKVSAADAARINAICSSIRNATGAQAGVLVLPTTGSYTMDEFAVKTFEKNGVGEKGRDNGLLLVVATEDRAWRMEVGYGLEGVLPDGKVGTLARANLLPDLSKGNYGAGIIKMLTAVENELVAGGEAPAPGTGEAGISACLGPLLVLIIIVLVILIVAGRIKTKGWKGKGGFSGGSHGWGGGGFSGGGGGFSGGGGSFGGGSSGGGGAGGRF